MLSILIPIYGQDPSALLEDLMRQETIDRCEIIICDDGSPDGVMLLARLSEEYPAVKWLSNDVNIGRSATRNRLLEEAQHAFVVFIDGDCRIPEGDYFIERYVQMSEPNTILCGGHIYAGETPASNFRLHHAYGRQRESVTLQIRETHPMRYFFSSNFCAPRTLLQEIGFNESMARVYGYEDSGLGRAWVERGRQIRHIDNAVRHDGLSSNEVFLAKAEQAVTRLALSFHQDDLNHVQLLKVYRRIIRWPFGHWMLSRIASRVPQLRARLLKKHGPMWCYDVYRLGLLHRELEH